MSQEWSLTPAYEQPKRKGKGLIISGVVLLVLGVLLLVGGIVGFGRGFGGLIDSVQNLASPATSPDSVSASLKGDSTYAVYERADSSSEATLSPSDISVVGPDGAAVPVVASALTNTSVDIGNGDYFTAVAQFDTAASGTYTVAVAPPGIDFAVGPGFSGDQIAGLGIGVVLLLAAFLSGLVGLVLLIIGLVQRSKSGKQAAVGYGQPAVGYAGTAYGAAPTQPYVAPAQTPQPQIFEQPGAPEQQPFAAPSSYEPAPPAAPAAPVPPPAAALPPAGWYPDPGRPGGQRYWDGQQWTEHQA